MMFNETSTTLLLRTILLLMEKDNTTHVTNIPSGYNGELELEQCYGIYGCFSIAYPWTENRPEIFFPMDVGSLKIKFPVFTRRNRKIPVFLDPNNREQIQKANIDSNGPFYLITHGFLEKGSEQWIQNMANALLDIAGNDAATVIVIDWREGSPPPYGQAVANIRLIGTMTAHLIHDIYEVLQLSHLDNFHFIGHSLGAHLGGYCGHELQKRFNLKLGRITGMDPAGPQFYKTVTLVRLDRSDAHYVDIIHSNAAESFLKGDFGIIEPIGHVDFFPNNGSRQPGCPPILPSDYNPAILMRKISCDHQRSYELFTESIAPSCPFLAIQCASYADFMAGNCMNCDSKHVCIPLGYHSYKTYKHLQIGGFVDTNTNVVLYSLTGDKKPFCRQQYQVTVKLQNATDSRNMQAEYGNIEILLMDKYKNATNSLLMNDDTVYYEPGRIETRMLAFRNTGYPPQYAVVKFIRQSTLWDIKFSVPCIYIEYVKITSIEHNTEITVCPKKKKPSLDKMPDLMKTKYCKF